jgi:tetratricopeptide (TPR) repeat protein
VFWVHASSYTRFEQGYREIANKLKLSGRDDPKIEILQLVSRWLRDETNGFWLLILDNADDANIFTPAVPQPAQYKDEMSPPSLLSYIPQTSSGSVLVTSRNTDAACRIIGNNSIINIGSMSEIESMTLLKAKLKHESSDSLNLVQTLGQIPLAITQAAAYIVKSPRMYVTKYLDLYRQSEVNQSSLLNRDEGDLRRDPEVPSAVITAWQISFNQIRRDNPSAADLLSLMSVLNRQGIPEDLLRGDSDRLAFEDALAALSRFSLIMGESSGGYFEMHRLIQLATRKWLEKHNEILMWNKKALKMISEAFPSGAYENWTTCMPLLSHAEVVLSYDLQEKEDLLKKALILHNLAWYFWVKGDYQLSKLKIDETIRIRVKYLTNEDTGLLASIGICASVLKCQGKYAEAEDMQQQTLKLREEVLGLEHPSTLRSTNNLGVLLKQQGKYAEAEEMHQQTLKLQEKVLGLEHPDTLNSMNNLGVVLGQQGKYTEAEDMHQQTLKLQEKMLSLKNPDTLTSMNNLGVALGRQDKYTEAEEMHYQTLKLQEKVLGLEHPDTLNSMNNLGVALRQQGKYVEAKDMHYQTLKLQEKVLGLEHPDTLTSMSNLGIALSHQGNYAKGEDLHQQTLKLQEKVLGLEHPDTLRSMNGLGVALSQQGKYAEAMDMHQQTLKLREKVLGLKHPDTLRSMNDLGVAIGQQGKYAEAMDMHQQTLKLREKVLGLGHPDTLRSISNVAGVLSWQGKYAEAEDMHQQTLKLREKVLGLEHPETLTSMAFSYVNSKDG